MKKPAIFNVFSCSEEVFQLFIGLRWDEKIIPFCIKLPKTSGYVKSFDESKYISSLTNDKQVLEKYYEICSKVNNITFVSMVLIMEILKYLNKIL